MATLQLLREWACKKWCKRKELESLIGSLHHVTKVVPPGRTFLRRMIDLLCAFCSPSHPIRLNREFRRDLAWSVSSVCPRFVLFPTCLSRLIPPVQSALARFGETRGFRELGQRRYRLLILRRWSCFLSWWRRSFGVVTGNAFKLNSSPITMRWWPSSTRDPRVICCRCITCVASFSSLVNSTSLSQPVMFWAVTTPR